MKNLARGSVILTLVALVAVFFIAETKTEAALVIANDSKGSIQRSNNENSKNINLIKIIKEVESTEIKSDFSEIENLINAAVVSSNSKGKLSSMGAFTATAYCLKGRTATGGSVRRGIVAADPRVLPLGTRITLSAGAYSGSYVVADTGGAVKGRKLDIWVPNCSEARRFGRRTVSVSR